MRNLFRSKKDESLVEILPYTIFCINNQNLNELHQSIDAFLKDDSKKEYTLEHTEDIIVIQKDIVDDPKKNKKQYTSYEISKKENQILIHAQNIEVDTASQEETSTIIDLNDKKNKLINTILTHVNLTLDDGFLSMHQENKMEFITSLSLSEKNFFFSQLQQNEIYLACLGITNLKSELFELSKKNDYHLAITSERALIIGSGAEGFSIHDISTHPLSLKEKTGKDTITSDQFSFDTELFNDTLFVLLQPIFTSQDTSDRIEKYADVLFKKYNTKETHLGYIKKLYEYPDADQNQLKRNLKSKLIFQFPKKQCAEKLVLGEDVIALLPTEETLGLLLYQILDDWDISAEEQYTFLELLVANQETHKLSNLAVFYDAAIARIANQKKPPKEIKSYRIAHLNFLKETKQYQKAIPYYEYTLEHLADDSILELISDTTTNILEGKDCNPLRVQLLEDLSYIKTASNVSNEKELLALAQLQPLVLDRQTQLVSAGILSSKANDILSLFTPGGLIPNKNVTVFEASTETYTKDDIFKKVVPDCFKNATGFMDSFNNLIAQVNPPDYKQVTQFSEKLDASNFPEANAILQELVNQLQMDPLECYIGNGDYSRGIIGVEGSPNFIILGKDHLQSASIYYFTKNELKFNLAMELTHILLEHTRITSKDVWRGAKSKGMDIAGVLLVALPVLSSVGNIAGKFINLTSYTNLFSGVQKVTNVVEKGQTAVEYGEKITDKFTNSQKESELLATSRIMEISADRVGLLVTNDLASCIRVLLKTSDDFTSSQEKINKDGLFEYLKQQNGKKEFIHQELILRLKTLCSFYLKM